MNVCLIPARGGSKRIPGKNIKPFLGKPIIHYPILEAINSELFDNVVVSTDDEEIKEVALDGWAETYWRDPEAATDGAETEDAIQEFIDGWEWPIDILCVMYPTSVFANYRDLRTAVPLLKDTDIVFSVTSFGYPVQRALETNGSRAYLVNPYYNAINSQELPTRYHDAAQFYMFCADTFEIEWARGKRLLEMRNHYYVYSPSMVRDIDTEDDWKIAEAIYQGRIL